MSNQGWTEQKFAAIVHADVVEWPKLSRLFEGPKRDSNLSFHVLKPYHVRELYGEMRTYYVEHSICYDHVTAQSRCQGRPGWMYETRPIFRQEKV